MRGVFGVIVFGHISRGDFLELHVSETSYIFDVGELLFVRLVQRFRFEVINISTSKLVLVSGNFFGDSFSNRLHFF